VQCRQAKFGSLPLSGSLQPRIDYYLPPTVRRHKAWLFGEGRARNDRKLGFDPSWLVSERHNVDVAVLTASVSVSKRHTARSGVLVECRAELVGSERKDAFAAILKGDGC
jgi:hypothetical protein